MAGVVENIEKQNGTRIDTEKARINADQAKSGVSLIRVNPSKSDFIRV
jgi:hypothetical protein